MVPFQTILALFLLLAAISGVSGCSQKPPPGSNWKPRTAPVFVGGGFSTDPSPSPSPAQSGTPVPGSTEFTIEAKGAAEWVMTIASDAAKHLYNVMPIQAEADSTSATPRFVKNGAQYNCALSSSGSTSCVIHMDTATGEIKNLRDKTAVKKGDPSETLDAAFVGGYLIIQKSPDPFAKLNVAAAFGKQIYENLTKGAQVDGQSADSPPLATHWRAGKHVKCLMTEKKPDNDYLCTFFIDFEFAEIEEIKPPY